MTARFSRKLYKFKPSYKWHLNRFLDEVDLVDFMNEYDKRIESFYIFSKNTFIILMYRPHEKEKKI